MRYVGEDGAPHDTVNGWSARKTVSENKMALGELEKIAPDYKGSDILFPSTTFAHADIGIYRRNSRNAAVCEDG